MPRASLDRLHPALREWFTSQFAGLSEIQRRALPESLAGKNVLILAPTGSGKTLAAFLSVLSRLAREAEHGAGLPNAVRAVYVSPLRSLSRDIHRNLQPPLDALNAALPPARRIRMDVRTGDTDASDRSRMQRRRPHLLLTTPESLTSLLSQSGWSGGFAPIAAIVDEVHAFAESKRGVLLALTLERLNAREPRMQRIGLSATASPVEEARRLLCGDRLCSIARVDLRKSHRLELAELRSETVLIAGGFGTYRVAFDVADLVARAQCSLIFCTTRSAAEQLGLALKVILPEWDEQIEVHHGSVDRDARLAIEAGLAKGAYRAVVCSSSLELGVDFAAVDQVILMGAPRGVSRAVQRLGRSGHRVDGVASGVIVPLSLPDLLESIALRRAASEGRLDDQCFPRNALDVLSQVLLGMAIERDWNMDEAFHLVRQAGPYCDLPRADFDAVLAYLAGGSGLLGGYRSEDGNPRYGKILIGDGTFRVASRRVAREYFLNVGTISDDYLVRVVLRNSRRLGQVEESFLAGLQPGDAFTVGGRAVALVTLHQDTAIVRPAAGERVKTPRWGGDKLSLTARMAEEERALRRSLRDAWERGGEAECARTLRSQWRVSRSMAARAAYYVRRQNHAAPVPVADPMQVERVVRGRTLLVIFHTVAGRAVNRSLAWVLGRRLGLDVGSIGSNYDDHGFLLSLSAKISLDVDALRAGFDPRGWREDLRAALEVTESLGRRFRTVAETGQLLTRRTFRGRSSARAASWNASLLYQTFLKYEPDHPLVRETVRETMEDELDAAAGEREAARIFAVPWEVIDLGKPSPFALPLFSFFNREILLAQDPDKALAEAVQGWYDEWEAIPS